MGRSDPAIDDDLWELAQACAARPDIELDPRPVDVRAGAPMNPPMEVQEKFVGASYADAYAEAARFVTQADVWARGLGTPLDQSRAVLDFGVGWGRIARMLLARVPAERIYALDVDPHMVALVQATLPGVNAFTVDPAPPSALRDALAQHVFAFSVFSHLAEFAHRAWAEELARVVAPGGLVFLTVLDGVFLTQVQQCKDAVAEGSRDPFTLSLAELIPDAVAAQSAYDRDEFIYAAPSVQDGPRTTDFYGWAVAPRGWVERQWGLAGFDTVQWLDSHTIVPQALVCLRRRVPPLGWRARLWRQQSA